MHPLASFFCVWRIQRVSANIWLLSTVLLAGCGYYPQHLSLAPAQPIANRIKLTLARVNNHTFFAGLGAMLRGAMRKQLATAAAIVQVAQSPSSWHLQATANYLQCTSDNSAVPNVVLVHCSVTAHFQLHPPTNTPTKDPSQTNPTTKHTGNPTATPNKPNLAFTLSTTATSAENKPNQTISTLESPAARNTALGKALSVLAHQMVEQIFLRTLPSTR